MKELKFFRSFMARYVRFLILGLVLLVGLECGVFVWLDRVYFKSDPNFRVTHLSASAFSKAANAHVAVDSDGSGFQCSYDGSYVSYMSGNKLIIVDMSSGTKITVPDVTGESMEIIHYVWAYDRNRIILAEKGTGSSNSRIIRLFNFQPSEKDDLEEIDNVANNQKFSIDLAKIRSLNAATTTVSDITFSTMNQLTYIQLTDKNGNSFIYRLNIEADSDTVDIPSGSIGRILPLRQSAALLYEDTKTGYVYSAQLESSGKYTKWTSKQVIADGNKKMKLIGVDSDDNVYLAPTDGKTTGKILYGSLKNGAWQTSVFRQAEPLGDLLVTPDGKIYLNDPENHVLKDIHASTQTAYKGDLVGIYDDGFMTRTDGTSAAASSGSSGKNSRASSAASYTSGATVWCNSFADDPIPASSGAGAVSSGTGSSSSRTSGASSACSSASSSRPSASSAAK